MRPDSPKKTKKPANLEELSVENLENGKWLTDDLNKSDEKSSDIDK